MGYNYMDSQIQVEQTWWKSPADGYEITYTHDVTQFRAGGWIDYSEYYGGWAWQMSSSYAADGQSGAE